MKSIVIVTKSNSHNEWLAFSSWYSIHRNSPDTTIGVVFPRKNKSYHFNWLRKCQVPFVAYPQDWAQEKAVDILVKRDLKYKPTAVIPDTIMMIRSDGFNSEISWVPADSQEISSFVDISIIGKFNLSEWIEKKWGHPFHKTTQLLGKNRTINEQRVVALWRQMAPTFDFIIR